jgi:large subunit ribosomal protein L17
MRKFGRTTDQRRAFIKSLAANLILKEKIKTTEARAKAMRPFVERLITRSKSRNLASRRYLASVLPSAAAKKVDKELSARFAERKGGYTRITRLGQRMTDGAKVAFIEFVK